MKSLFIVCNLEENYGMTVYDSKEEFVENFKYMFEMLLKYCSDFNKKYIYLEPDNTSTFENFKKLVNLYLKYNFKWIDNKNVNSIYNKNKLMKYIN